MQESPQVMQVNGQWTSFICLSVFWSQGRAKSVVHTNCTGRSKCIPCGHCRTAEGCNYTTGYCTDGCAPNWYGKGCFEEDTGDESSEKRNMHSNFWINVLFPIVLLLLCICIGYKGYYAKNKDAEHSEEDLDHQPHHHHKHSRHSHHHQRQSSHCHQPDTKGISPPLVQTNRFLLSRESRAKSLRFGRALAQPSSDRRSISKRRSALRPPPDPTDPYRILAHSTLTMRGLSAADSGYQWKKKWMVLKGLKKESQHEKWQQIKNARRALISQKESEARRSSGEQEQKSISQEKENEEEDIDAKVPTGENEASKEIVSPSSSPPAP